jgi:hypothetical protein
MKPLPKHVSVAMIRQAARKLLSRESAIKEALVISGHLPWPKWYFDAACAGVYPIQTREARQSALEIRG